MEIKNKYRSIDMKENGGMNEDEYVKLVERIHSSLDKRLSCVSEYISSIRNDINHFGFSNSCEPYDNLLKNLKKNYAEFINLIGRE